LKRFTMVMSRPRVRRAPRGARGLKHLGSPSGDYPLVAPLAGRVD